ASAVLRTLGATAMQGRLAARDDLGRVALVRVAAARLRGIVPASLELAAVGATVLGEPGKIQDYRLIALEVGRPAGGESVSASAGEPTLTQASRPRGSVVRRGMSPRRAEVVLLRSLPNPRDGIVDPLLNRPLSRLLTPRLLPLPITPNAVT